MENSKLLTILVEIDEGHKTPIKAYNEILVLFGVGSNEVAFCECGTLSNELDVNGRCEQCGCKPDGLAK